VYIVVVFFFLFIYLAISIRGQFYTFTLNMEKFSPQIMVAKKSRLVRDTSKYMGVDIVRCLLVT